MTKFRAIKTLDAVVGMNLAMKCSAISFDVFSLQLLSERK